MRKFQALFLMLLVSLWICSAVNAAAPASMDKMKALAGEWDGTNTDGKAVHISYKLVSGGSAVMETIQAEKEDMVTMYYADGNSVMMTHYCMSQNQPRMKASGSGENNTLIFNFVDVTNLPSPTAGHMHHLVLKFPDNDHLTQQWTWTQDGKDKVETMTLTRKK